MPRKGSSVSRKVNLTPGLTIAAGTTVYQVTFTIPANSVPLTVTIGGITATFTSGGQHEWNNSEGYTLPNDVQLPAPLPPGLSGTALLDP